MSPSPQTKNKWCVKCSPQELSGFEELFPDGIAWPGPHPLHMLIVGPEGSGKTTMALQLAIGCDLSEVKEDEVGHEVRPAPPRTRCVLYCTPDDIVSRVDEKIGAFRLPHNRQNKKLAPAHSIPPGEGLDKGTILYQMERIPRTGRDPVVTTASVDDFVGKKLDKLRDVYRADEYIVVLDSIAGIAESEVQFSHLLGRHGPELLNGLPYPAMVILTNELWVQCERSPYLSDVVIHVAQAEHEEALAQGFCERYIQVVKAANCRHARGVHTFHIVPDYGMEIWPSPQLQVDIIRGVDKDRKPAGQGGSSKVTYGVPGTDECLRDLELDKGSVTYLCGSAGTLKTPQAMYFIKQEIETGPALFVSLTEPGESLKAHLKAVDPDIGDKLDKLVVCSPSINPEEIRPSLEKNKNAKLLFVSLQEYFISPATMLTFMRQVLELLHDTTEQDVTRFVLDGTNQIANRYPRLSRESAFLPLLVDLVRAYGCTSLFVADSVPKREGTPEWNMRHLADNVFLMDSVGAERNVHVLLNVEKRGGRPVRDLPIHELRRIRLQRAPTTIEATRATERYARNAAGRLVPVQIRLCLNSFAKTHDRFNRMIKLAFSPGAVLDESTARQRGANFGWRLKALRVEQEQAIVLAVDEAYLECDKAILKYFSDVGEWARGEIDKFVKGTRKRCILNDDDSVRLLPACIDHSVVLFYPRLLDEPEENKDAHEPTQIPDAVRALKEKILEQCEGDRLPVVPVDDFVKAAEEWGSQEIKAKDGSILRFFNFYGDRDVENVVGLLLEWLRAMGVEPQCPVGKLRVNVHDWRKALVDFAKVYLAGWSKRPPQLTDVDKEKQVKREPCLFYRTWHSIAFSAPDSEDAIPIHIDETWKATRGGWFWGVVDTGSGREIASKVLEFALNEQMAVHKIAQRVYLPANIALLDRQDDQKNLFNTQLMLREYEDACSRADIELYLRVSPFIHDFFLSYLDLLSRRSGPDYLDKSSIDYLTSWLEKRLKSLKEVLRRIYSEGEHPEPGENNERPI